MAEAHEFMTLKEAARELRLSVSTLKRYIYSGQLQTYRTPGGRHRVRGAELAALLGAGPAASVPEPQALARADALAEQAARRVDRALHRRLVRLEMEVERLECSVEAISAAVRQPAVPSARHISAGPPTGGCEIKVLGPGCRACDRLAGLVEEIARALGIRSEAVSRVRELDEIAEYGPAPMPALIINNQLVSAGRLPNKSRLTELLRRCLTN
jgi:excisionase family DNA binding protein